MSPFLVGASGPEAFTKLSGGLHHLVSHSVSQPVDHIQANGLKAAGSSPHLHSFHTGIIIIL